MCGEQRNRTFIPWLHEKHLSRMPQQTNICLLSINNSIKSNFPAFSASWRIRRVKAEGAGLEPANAVIRTAVFKTAALPVMLTFHIMRAGWELNPRYIGFADQSLYQHWVPAQMKPHRDLNPDCTDFKSVVSFLLDYAAGHSSNPCEIRTHTKLFLRQTPLPLG